MCLVPGVTCQLMVSGGRGRGENSFGKLTGLLLFVTPAHPRADWHVNLRPSLAPTSTWPVLDHRLSQRAPGDLVKRRGCRTMLHMCETQVVQKDWEWWFFLTWGFTSLVPNYVLCELEVIGRNLDLSMVHVYFLRNFKQVIKKQITINENVHPRWTNSTFKYLFIIAVEAILK